MQLKRLSRLLTILTLGLLLIPGIAAAQESDWRERPTEHFAILYIDGDQATAERYAGFGDLSMNPDEPNKYGFIGYIPNTDLMDSGFDYGQMFIVKDALCDGTAWHKRDLPKNPATEPYFPLGQAALKLLPANDALRVELKTFTPNLKTFELRTDNHDWRDITTPFDWKLHKGLNRLEARTINAFSVKGPSSVVEVRME